MSLAELDALIAAKPGAAARSEARAQGAFLSLVQLAAKYEIVAGRLEKRIEEEC